MDPPQKLRGLSEATGLSSLPELQKQVDRDARRIGANIALNQSMGKWMERKRSAAALLRDEPAVVNNSIGTPSSPPTSSREMALKRSVSTFSQTRHKRVSGHRLHMDGDSIQGLEEAFNAHVAAFDMEGSNRICVDELILVLDRCRLFDDCFTPSKVRNHFSTWAEGCNISCTTEPLTDDGIGFQEFQFVLQWASDVKCVELERCVEKVVRLSRKLCDKEASVQRRIEVVFDSFCKQDSTRMTAFEFGNLCKKIDVPVCMGDVFLIFGQQAGGLQEGVDFQGFVGVLQEVGKKLRIGDEVFTTFARAVEFLDADDHTLTRIKMRLRQAASIVGGKDWQKFFHDCDKDNSGTLDWDEFLAICRERLHLADRDNHLRILFEKLDLDASGEISITSMIDFVAS